MYLLNYFSQPVKISPFNNKINFFMRLQKKRKENLGLWEMVWSRERREEKGLLQLVFMERDSLSLNALHRTVILLHEARAFFQTDEKLKVGIVFKDTCPWHCFISLEENMILLIPRIFMNQDSLMFLHVPINWSS